MPSEEIVINIKNSISNTSVKQEQTQSSSDVEDIEENTSENDGYSAKMAVAQLGARATTTAVSMIANEVKWHTNRNFSLNDDYIGQRYRDIGSTMISTITSDVSSIASWTMMGAQVGGPWGAVAGFVIGTTVTAINRAQNVSHALADQQLKIDQMDAQLSFNRQRAGFSLSAGSIGENL